MSNKKLGESRLDSFFQLLSEDLQLNLSEERKNFAVHRQLVRMRKRAEYSKSNLRPESLAKFESLNDSLSLVNVDLPASIVNNARLFITTIFERYNTRLSDLNIQVALDKHHLFDLWAFGPGASNGVKGTHACEKISQKMTVTASCEPLVLRLRRTNPYFSTFDCSNGDCGTTILEGSKMTTVPKNEDTDRVIAIEPSGNMALQLAAGRYIEGVLRSIGLNISNQQPINKAMALRGSIDNSLATIDLKSASDMFKPELIELLMPIEWYELLMQIRSPTTSIGDRIIPLNMISTMGNGFTFPLMSLIIVSLIYAFRCDRGGPNLFVDWSSTAVFGDDIIIPSSEFTGFTSLLVRAGLIVNYDKSFSDGPFRESCGGDYFQGYDVTPFYVKSLLTDSQVYVAINQVLLWCGKHKLCLHRSLNFLGSLLKDPFFVPEWSNTDQGILTSQVPRRYKFLQPVVPRVRLTESHFLVPLACGGYVTSEGPHFVYSPRQFKTSVKVRRGRLPKGFLSGRDPCSRVIDQSVHIDNIVALVFR